MLIGGETNSLEVPAAPQFTELPISAGLAAGADFSLYAEEGTLDLDAVRLSGAPLPAAGGAEHPRSGGSTFGPDDPG